MINKIKQIYHDCKIIWRLDKTLRSDIVALTIALPVLATILGILSPIFFLFYLFTPIMWIVIYTSYSPIIRKAENEIFMQMKHTTLLKRFNKTY